jgi:hypothetical protein
MLVDYHRLGLRLQTWEEWCASNQSAFRTSTGARLSLFTSERFAAELTGAYGLIPSARVVLSASMPVRRSFARNLRCGTAGSKGPRNGLGRQGSLKPGALTGRCVPMLSLIQQWRSRRKENGSR